MIVEESHTSDVTDKAKSSVRNGPKKCKTQASRLLARWKLMPLFPRLMPWIWLTI